MLHTSNVHPHAKIPFSAHGLRSLTFLGEFAKLRKATISFVICLYVRQPICMELCSQWATFRIFYISMFSENFRENSSSTMIWQKFKYIYFAWRHMYVHDNVSLSSSYNDNVLDKSCREINKHYFKIAFNHKKNVIRSFNICYMCQLGSLATGISIDM
jgi:hypothetical protein